MANIDLLEEFNICYETIVKVTIEWTSLNSPDINRLLHLEMVMYQNNVDSGKSVGLRTYAGG